MNISTKQRHKPNLDSTHISGLKGKLCTNHGVFQLLPIDSWGRVRIIAPSFSGLP